MKRFCIQIALFCIALCAASQIVRAEDQLNNKAAEGAQTNPTAKTAQHNANKRVAEWMHQFRAETSRAKTALVAHVKSALKYTNGRLHELYERAKRLVSSINSRQTLWKAKFYEHLVGVPNAQLTGMAPTSPEMIAKYAQKQPEEPELCRMAPKTEEQRRRKRNVCANRVDLPQHFDARQHWPHCADVIGHIRSQGSCGSCWAVATGAMISDRMCIQSRGLWKINISARQIASCAIGEQCNGGKPLDALQFYEQQGVVDNICQRYDPLFVLTKTDKLVCSAHCDADIHPLYAPYYSMPNRYYGVLQSSKWYNNQVRKLDEDFIQNELYTNGPVVISLDFFEDLRAYKSGIYRHTTGARDGGHGVRLIGWGEERIAGCQDLMIGELALNNCVQKYWLVANSWNAQWGENGLFRIVRGENHLNVEMSMWTTQPYFAPPPPIVQPVQQQHHIVVPVRSTNPFDWEMPPQHQQQNHVIIPVHNTKPFVEPMPSPAVNTDLSLKPPNEHIQIQIDV